MFVKRAVTMLLAIVSVGCGSAAPSESPSSTSGPSSAPSSAPCSAASLDVSAAPTPPPASTAPSAKVTGLGDWTAAELFLLAGVDKKIRTTCAKAPKLPDGAYDGIQCMPAGIASIGFYAFDDRNVMRKLYFARLAEYKVKPDTGNLCMDGKPGEGIDTPGNQGYEARVGCYIDETGAANARLLLPADTAGQSVYVGVVGKNARISDLFSWLFPDYQPGATGCGWCIDSAWSMPGQFH